MLDEELETMKQEKKKEKETKPEVYFETKEKESLEEKDSVILQLQSRVQYLTEEKDIL